jgi:hypothetical protein
MRRLTDTERTNPATTEYPGGSLKRSTSPTAADGTEITANHHNEFWGASYAILNEAGITLNGLPETAINSQFLDALKVLLKRVDQANLSTTGGTINGDIDMHALKATAITIDGQSAATENYVDENSFPVGGIIEFAEEIDDPRYEVYAPAVINPVVTRFQNIYTFGDEDPNAVSMCSWYDGSDRWVAYVVYHYNRSNVRFYKNRVHQFDHLLVSESNNPDQYMKPRQIVHYKGDAAHYIIASFDDSTYFYGKTLVNKIVGNKLEYYSDLSATGCYSSARVPGYVYTAQGDQIRRYSSRSGHQSSYITMSQKGRQIAHLHGSLFVTHHDNMLRISVDFGRMLLQVAAPDVTDIKTLYVDDTLAFIATAGEDNQCLYTYNIAANQINLIRTMAETPVKTFDAMSYANNILYMIYLDTDKGTVLQEISYTIDLNKTIKHIRV